ncbi:biopolymer transporter ExbD [Balneolaceae bacterium ANBcel3]|nr:biopolymer transporter ExbD [Balneolaceae bacterium ANBcel3]
MKQSRFLLRFVDVVLILLFGFIVISDIDEDSDIVLPSSTETALFQPGAEVVLFIGIGTNGEFFDERHNIMLESEENLKRYIRQHKNRYGDLAKVRIRANYDTLAQYAIRAAEICDEIGIKKAIDVRIVSR